MRFLLLLSSFVILSSSFAAERPNILFVLSDDHSYPFLGCYGRKEMKTPSLDRIAAEGMLFRRMFTGAPQCVPSRATIMTGRSPVAARITRFSSPLPRDEITFPEILKSDAGYFVGVCGRSYHLDGSGRAPAATEAVSSWSVMPRDAISPRSDRGTTGPNGEITVSAPTRPEQGERISRYPSRPEPGPPRSAEITSISSNRARPRSSPVADGEATATGGFPPR
jgi:arylsulfatase A-like enzyme